jgi:hypothetical protein
MPGLRPLLLRTAPLLLGALAAGVWLRRRGPRRAALAGPPDQPQIPPPAGPIDIAIVVDDLGAVEP